MKGIGTVRTCEEPVARYLMLMTLDDVLHRRLECQGWDDKQGVVGQKLLRARLRCCRAWR